MKRFFFHIVAGEARAEDPVGSFHADLGSARAGAIDDLRFAFAERHRAGEPFVDLAVEICDEHGTLQAMVSTSADAIAH